MKFEEIPFFLLQKGHTRNLSLFLVGRWRDLNVSLAPVLITSNCAHGLLKITCKGFGNLPYHCKVPILSRKTSDTQKYRLIT